MRCQHRFPGVHWFEHVTNIPVARRTNLPHIGAFIPARRYSLFGQVVGYAAEVASNMTPKMCRDISMNCRIPATWKRPRGRPHSSWIAQVKSDTGVPVANSWKRANDRDVSKAGTMALRNYAV